MKKAKRQNVVAQPKPVLPSSVRTHGLFGLTYVREHMIVDDRWTMNSLTEEFRGMSNLLTKRKIFATLQTNWNHTRQMREYRNLRRQCRDGRLKLQMSLQKEATMKIRNYLINHKDMQRLYQRMPTHMVVENIDQRTFVMAKERDRLQHKMDLLKKEYEDKLLQCATLENRIKYDNIFQLEEERKSFEFRKFIENSRVRLMAAKTINVTYTKMLQVLHHDAIFYEPIMRSLNKDIEDQANFIKNVLFLGSPALSEFKVLSEQYRKMEDKSRKNLQAKQQFVANYRNNFTKRYSAPKTVVKPLDRKEILKRYVRETESMKFLKNELEAIESTIKQIKFATLCSQAREIMPRMKSQADNNQRLLKSIQNDILGHQNLKQRMMRAGVLQGVLINNLTEDELIRAETIRGLQEDIAREDEFEARALESIKNRANLYVLLRCSLWNLNEILRFIDRTGKVTRVAYPNSYLKLPLLKFETLTMHACPPDPYEENIDAILNVVKHKLHKLMRAYKPEKTPEKIKECREEYHNTFLDNMDFVEPNDGGGDAPPPGPEEVELEFRLFQLVPDRAQIKLRSAKLVEEHLRKDD